MANSQWQILSDRSRGLYVPEDYEQAAYRLITEQVLYYGDRVSRKDCMLVMDHLREFGLAMEPMGVTLKANSVKRFVAALPRHSRGGPVPLDETLVALTLRKVYDQHLSRGDVNEANDVECSIEELQQAYQLACSRELPDKGRLDAILRTMRRWGIATVNDEDSGDGQPYQVHIRPGIEVILGEEALMRLAAHATREGVPTVQNMSAEAEDENA